MLRIPVGLCAALLLALLVLLAVAAPVLLHAKASAVDVNALQQGVSGTHWLGTDNLGRDVLARALVATRLSLELAVLAALIGTLAGVLLGALPGVLGRRLGRLLVAVIDLLVAFPGLLLALFLAVVFGVGARGAVLAIGIALMPGFARLTHTLSASVIGSDYVAAARILGVRRRRLLLRHVLPNIAEPLIINATVAVGVSLLSFAGLSFLGFGVQAPDYDWGRMLNEGLSRIYVNPAAALAPGVAVVIAGIAFNLAGDAAARSLGERGAIMRRLPAAVREVVPPRTQAVVAPSVSSEVPVLRIESLSVRFATAAGEIAPVADVSFSIAPGEIVGVVGESGSGKSLTAAAIADLVPHPGMIDAASIELLGHDLTRLSPGTRGELLGRALAMVFQDPMSALNPALRVGRQLAEVAEVHDGAGRREARERAVQRLRAVRIPAPQRRARQYPHEFSGGMRQRAVIGMGLMLDPALILADEPTTALDLTVQRQILALLRRVRDEHGTAVLLISHDIAVITELADRVLVMYAGRIVETLPADELRTAARHPYTRALVASVPELTVARDRPLATIAGRPPEPAAMPPGCAFAPRCAFTDHQCITDRPPLAALPDGLTDGHVDGRQLACWHPQHGPLRAPVSILKRATV
ncbi:MAG: dipeptide/oligopeptide/nickel ABC transporter permease/ATP-binding protein [Mycobacteriales bacterium]